MLCDSLRPSIHLIAGRLSLDLIKKGRFVWLEDNATATVRQWAAIFPSKTAFFLAKANPTLLLQSTRFAYLRRHPTLLYRLGKRDHG